VIAALAVLATFRGERPRVDDDELLARHRAGDPDAFAALYRAHAPAVYRRLTRILGPISARDDLTQDVFLALYRALPRFRGEAKLSTLIHRIAINKAYEHLRGQSRRPATLVATAVFDELLADEASPEAHACTREELARVFACLARIKPKKRIALLLRVVDGLSFEEIGELVDATPEAVAKRVQHGQRELDAWMARIEHKEAS
jgi:RNA polymerase sigma-70 factor (ECF subfamily)